MMQDLLAELRARFASASPRERAGVTIVAALALSAAAANFFDWAMAADARSREARQALTRVQAAYAVESDAEYQQASAENFNRAWRWSVVADSDSAARDQALSIVEALALDAGLADMELSLSEAELQEPAGAALILMRAQFEWGAVLSLLNKLRDAEPSIVVRAVEMAAGVDGGPELRMSLAVPYLVEAAP